MASSERFIDMQLGSTQEADSIHQNPDYENCWLTTLVVAQDSKSGEVTHRVVLSNDLDDITALEMSLPFQKAFEQQFEDRKLKDNCIEWPMPGYWRDSND